MKQRVPLPPLSGSPTVSVVMTSYNYAAFARDAIASVYAQTRPPDQFVIVDDGSEDNSRAVIESATAGAPVPTETVFQENRGQAEALNAGFARATGDLVCCLDSDDVWHPEKVARMVQLAHDLPDGGVYQHQLARGQRVEQPFLRSGDLYAAWAALGTVNLAIHRELAGAFVPTSGLMWRKDVLERILPVPRALRTCPDAYLTRLACLHGPLYSYPAALGTWREHPGNAGKAREYSFHGFWRPVIMPLLNAAFAERGAPIRFVYRPAAVLWEPVRLVREALARRRG